MRCRKARSLLSAACSEELGGRETAAVREHLASCPACRKEASYYESISQAAREIPSVKVSDDFNTRLLNRIAEERFGETRTRAFMPKRAPRFGWRMLTPVAVTATLLAVVAINIYKTDQPVRGAQVSTERTVVASVPGHIDDSYLYIQPTNNPNVTVDLKQDWSLQQHLAQTERLERISRQLTNRYGFGNMHLTSGTVNQPVILPGRFFPAPTVTVYQVSGRSAGGEDRQTY